MSFRYPVPSEEQLGRLTANGVTIPHGKFFVSYADNVDGSFALQNYETGDEISYRPGLRTKRLRGEANGN